MTNDSQPLSPTGEARRDAILGLALGAAARRRRRRRAVRVAGATAALAVVAAGTWVAMPKSKTPDIAGPPARSGEPAGETRPPTLAATEASPPPSDPIELIGDEELLDLLAATGRPAGLIEYADGRERLIWR